MKDEKFSNMTEALKSLERAGFTTNFVYECEHLRASQISEIFYPADLKIVDIYRFEGASNPDDMAVIYALESKDGIKGTLVDSFGIYASSDIGRFISKVDDARKANRRVDNALPSDPW